MIDDCALHPCVRYGRFESDKVLLFVPPNGNFELMRYRVKNLAAQGLNPPLYVKPHWSFTDNSGEVCGSLTLLAGVRSISSLILSPSWKGSIMVEKVAITMPLPKSVKTANFGVNIGTVLYNEAAKIANWTLRKLDCTKKPQLQASL